MFPVFISLIKIKPSASSFIRHDHKNKRASVMFDFNQNEYL